jgi:hypothetical protein
LSNLNDPLLALPRIEAGNLDDLQRIISKSGLVFAQTETNSIF